MNNTIISTIILIYFRLIIAPSTCVHNYVVIHNRIVGNPQVNSLGLEYSEFRRTSNSVSRSVSRSGLRDGKFMVGKVQCFYIVTYGKNKS